MFWGETHDKASTLKIPELVQAKLIKDNAEKDPEYYGQRKGVVHVSGLYGCIRGQIHDALGSEKTAEVDGRKLGVFKAGNLFEDFVVDSLGDLVQTRQNEYLYKHKSIVLTGRDDGEILHEGKHAILEAKSVHSDSFWYRQKEGTLIQWHNQIQLQTYLWLRRQCPFLFLVDGLPLYTNMTEAEIRVHKPQAKEIVQQEKPDWSELGGAFSYISKDDCTVESAPVKFNPRFISEIVEPILDTISEGFEKNDPNIAPAPALAVFIESKKQWQVNWLAKYCEYHNHCAGAGWLLEAQDEVARRNKELKAGVFKKATDAVNGN